MERRTLGSTGLEVSVLGFGASSLGGVFRPVEEERAIRTVRVALDAGIDLIDVAPYYGSTRAETVLGKALREVSRDAYTLATKVGRYGLDDFDFSRARVLRSVDESLARLGVDHVDLIQCHDIEFGDLSVIVEETLPALRELVVRGKARFVGLTGLPLGAFRRVLARSRVDTVLSYCRHTLQDTSLRGLLDELGEAGVGVINASPLSMGLLTERGPPDWHPACPAIRAACAEAAACCRRRGEDIARVALRYSVDDPRIASTLVGTASPENLERNRRWVSEPVDPELLAEVLAVLAPVRDMSWPSGRPENA